MSCAPSPFGRGRPVSPRYHNFFYLENGEKLVLAEFEKGVALAAPHLFEIENIFVKRDGLFDVVHFNGDVIASINLHAHKVI